MSRAARSALPMLAPSLEDARLVSGVIELLIRLRSRFARSGSASLARHSSESGHSRTDRYEMDCSTLMHAVAAKGCFPLTNARMSADLVGVVAHATG